jgi:hypothetical protein
MLRILSDLGREKRANPSTGFTLVEIILSVAILSCGLMVIDQSLLLSLTRLNHVYQRFESNRLLANKIWEVRDDIMQKGKKLSGEAGILMGMAEALDYEMHVSSLTPDEVLRQIELKVFWKEGAGTKSLERSFYVLGPADALEAGET